MVEVTKSKAVVKKLCIITELLHFTFRQECYRQEFKKGNGKGGWNFERIIKHESFVPSFQLFVPIRHVYIILFC